MKKVKFQYGEFLVPDWVNYIAMDLDGAIFAYELQPILIEDYWRESRGKQMLIKTANYVDCRKV